MVKENDFKEWKSKKVLWLDQLVRQDRISEAMAKNLLELLDINPAYYWPRKYRYTLESDAGKTNPLTVKERNQFERNGYVVIRNLIPKDLLGLFSNCPKDAINDLLSLVIKQKELVHKVKAFCGEQTEHIATMIIDNLYTQRLDSSVIRTENKLNQELTSIAQLAQHFYSFNVHPADRIVGCLIFVENSNELSICLEPASHQSSRLEVEMRDSNGELIRKIYEKPIRRLETINEQTERRELVTLRPGDVFFYHPLLAQSILFEQQIKEEKNLIKNLNSIENTDLNDENKILALNVFYGSSDLVRIIRNYGVNYARSANCESPFKHLKLLDKFLEVKKDKDDNQLLKEANQIFEQDQLHEQTSDDLKSLNVQIFIGNSIINLEQALADADEVKKFVMKSHL